MTMTVGTYSTQFQLFANRKGNHDKVAAQRKGYTQYSEYKVFAVYDSFIYTVSTIVLAEIEKIERARLVTFLFYVNVPIPLECSIEDNVLN